jgi:HPt (histidine-containing phosphotransfer) domain-containing protein
VNENPIDRKAFEALVEMTGGELAFVDELVDTYLEDGREQVAALEMAVAASDVAALIRPAHSLKASSVNVGALVLGGLCQELERRSRTGVLDDAAERVAAIAEGFERASEALLEARLARGST